MISAYRELIKAKMIAAKPAGFTPSPLRYSLFPFQKDVVTWACRKGRAALFEDCGLGKTRQQLAWADQVVMYTGKRVLVLAPLAVAEQTIEEGERIGVQVQHCREPSDITGNIIITNYERSERFLECEWGGIVLDESSIIKSHDGHYRSLLIAAAQAIPYRLACTATPAPNDHMELGNHAEFLGVMTRTEMLATFFVHDMATTQEWRLKGHAVADFWRWVASWAVMIRTPSDIGHSDDGFILPELRMVEHVIPSNVVKDGNIFAMAANGLQEQREAKRQTMDQRIAKVAELTDSDPDQWLIWCEMNDEGDGLETAIHDAVQVAGSDDEEDKTSRMMGFSHGLHRTLISKTKIAGFGMNWQNCHNVAFVGATNSYEGFYQSVRRCWRFGQKHPVTVHIVSTDLDANVIENLKRKQNDAALMAAEMVKHMSDITKADITGTVRMTDTYKAGTETGKAWEMRLGDCVESLANQPNDSIGYTVFSPPFASLYTYSNSQFDMGNCKDIDSFMTQFRFLIGELLRVTMPGRLLSFHCMNMPTSKERDGFIGIRDFRGELIRAFTEAGWIFHSEVCIWKDPVTAMQRTKALGLLHKQLKKDSCMSRQGIPDYLVTMRKPGINADRVTNTGETFPVQLWQEYASPVWMDINPSDTLQKSSAREENDERHICPLQLQVIERALKLWSKEGDLVLSPFAGIGSEGYMAVKMGRRFLGCELKQSYFNQACANLRNVEQVEVGQTSIFDDAIPIQ